MNLKLGSTRQKMNFQINKVITDGGDIPTKITKIKKDLEGI